ncbi:hypothetical protein BU24DRAFT_429146 [Aaosphaeria arxii CBS 175.79]|uniref:Uncharacterized protein n=1 Tax=Aaosphaeria arxii CBS 175.79 TaxID=1450172 RepID=A0A6A5X7K8_9PLEO|nr:uncharacterized protein BU24DRAFT_429146 [Aaosphaeria arxii CBS 175.79]KAF2008886.1 hypothetical protein BU24DRAFT_429146 [Aaosphaeria arxii CBS 175.79]
MDAISKVSQRGRAKTQLILPSLTYSKDDHIGKTCIFKDRIHWEYLVNNYCGMYDPGRVVPVGSYTLFAGNHRIDKGDGGPNHLITLKECHDDMMKIWDKCPERKGGWVDTTFGTVSIFPSCRIL